MSDLGDELRSTIEGAATPVTLDELATRTSSRERRGGGRAPWRTFVAGVAAAVLVIVGAVVVVNLGDDDPPPTRIAAPTVVVGDIDLAVLSTSFDGDGARGPIDPSVVDAVRAVPGVAGAQGAMQRFVDVRRTDTSTTDPPDASERSAIAISWEEGAPLTFSAGGPPQQSDEIAINQSLAAQYSVGVGDQLVLRVGPNTNGNVTRVLPSGEIQVQPAPTGSTGRVAGVFVPAGGDVDDVNLVVMRAEDLGTTTNRQTFDRIDVVAADHVPIEELLDRIAATLPADAMVVPPSVVGFEEQLRAELEIQRAYHWILSPDRSKGHDSSFGGPDDPETAARNQQTYDENYWQTKNTELRVSRVAFLDAHSALVTYRAYYAGVPSSVVRTPLTGVAEQIDGQWRLSSAGLCELSQAANIECAGTGGPTSAEVSVPPNGWNAPDSVAGAAQAFRVVADPATTAGQRVAVIDRGEQLRDAIEAGAKADAARGGTVTFNVSGARLLDDAHAQVLYSVIADGEPRLETPYPLVGNAVLVDGTWRVASRFACGLSALATLSCPPAAALPTTTTSTSSPTTTTSTIPRTTVPPSTVPPTTDPNSVEVPTTVVTPTVTTTVP
jgi:hypothetical protein